MTAARSPWIVAFAVILAIHLVLNGADVSPWVGITKVLIVPLLIAWVWSQNGPKLIIIALVFCTVGDLFLIWDDLVTAGMAAFAIGHGCFISFFIQRGAVEQLRRKWLIAAVYLVVAAALIGYLWDGLPADIKPLVPVYALLLVTTAATSLALDNRAGLGGALFLLSDGLIAMGEADKWQPAVPGVWIMALYGLGLFFLAAGILGRESSTRSAGDGFDPTIHTDCWPRVPTAR